MARLLPETPLGSVSTEIARVYRLLKQLPDDWTIWHRLSFWSEPGPDFWVLRPDQRGLLLKVAGATPAEVQSAGQFGLFDSQGASRPGQEERAALDSFYDTSAAQDGAVVWRDCLPASILFPNVAERDLRAALGDRVDLAGKERLTPDAFHGWLSERAGPPLTEAAVTAIRKALTPEIVIPPQFTVRQPIDRNVDAQLADYLLDYDQEWVLKTDLDLSSDARQTAGEFGLRLVSGVAGSGKSLIVVYRAQLLRRLYPDKSILVLTHNRPLIRDLEARYKQLQVPGARVEFNTFQGWCRKHWPQQPAWRDPIGRQRRETALTQAWHAHLADTAVSERMLGDELDWLKDRLLVGRDAYLAADRTGRGFALNEAQRQKVYDAFEAYHRDLAARQQVDWGDVPRRLWFAVEQGHRLPQYDIILVDEAQFFAPIWFELIKRSLKPVTGHLFMAADPTQGFLKRRQSWLACGLDVRGKAQRLEKSYRTTREILSAATLLYRARLPEDDEKLLSADGDLGQMPSGVVPVVVPLTSEQDETTRVVNEIRGLVQQGLRLGHILVIHADWRGVDRLLARLRTEFGADAAVDAKDNPRGDFIRVCTLNAVTGLESPIVFVMGVHELYEEEQSLRLSEEERAELIRDNTRKLYMAITRAGQRLVL
ncbi:MAG: DEAD/DEAH box helicase, partial [Anaerolineales bacterium]|nr:DEAD/DEAH box helicase [Anaerolineales bacterium]